MNKGNSEEIEQESLLYKLLDISPTATESEIRKSYKVLARKYHPDKNQEDPEAKSKFQQLSQAYKILSDPRKRRIYDTTGEIDGEGVGDISKFIDAYIYYREKYKEITPKDINEFKKTYVGGEEEEEDLIEYFEVNEGDMTKILEAIPYSSNKDKERFIKFFENLIKKGESFPEEYIENFEETKDFINDYEEELDENEAEERMNELQNKILGNMKSRGNDMMANLMAKYGGGDALMIENFEDDGFCVNEKKVSKRGKKGAMRGRKKRGER